MNLATLVILSIVSTQWKVKLDDAREDVWMRSERGEQLGLLD